MSQRRSTDCRWFLQPLMILTILFISSSFVWAANTITVTSPNGGEIWELGSTQTIRWTYTGTPGVNVKIDLYRSGAFNRLIIGRTPIGNAGSGSYTWTVPAGQKKDSRYKVKVSSTRTSSINDMSDKQFTITNAQPVPSITVTSPNGGETWPAGSVQTIGWTYTGDPGASVKIDLLKGGVVNQTITSSASIGNNGSGSYGWTVPASQEAGSDYRIRVTSTSNGAYTDTSNNDIAIVAVITVTSPNGGETWPVGSVQTIRWTYTGNPGTAVKINLLKGGVVNQTITSSASIGNNGSGSYGWTVSLSQAAGSDYRIRVTSTSDGTCTDTSDNNIHIVAVNLTEWPNAVSSANSDPWLAEHHDEITVMRPRILALNFVNHKTMEQMQDHMEQAIQAIAESTRYHGYNDPDAPAFLQYELAYAIDLRDKVIPPYYTKRNSTLYPRENPVEGYWGFDYEKLFTSEFTQLYNIANPKDPSRLLSLCELIDRGLVHEVWVYCDGDVPDVSMAEILELKPYYDEDRNRLPDQMNRCAGNGCFDAEDNIPCNRTVRIGCFNNMRGVGCYLESLSHGMESTGAWSPPIPYLSRYFSNFAGFDLDTRYGLPFDSWYASSGNGYALSYPTESSVTYYVQGNRGTINPYDPICGNVHFAPNGRKHYDLDSPSAVRTSCTHYRDGSGQTDLFTRSDFESYLSMAPDCMGGFLIWWRQNMPGLNNTALDDEGNPMLNWWPFLFY